MLNPLWLRTFVTLVDTGHFTQTANKLFMTQPGVSQHLNKLEQACGHQLLLRSRSGIELTEAGSRLYQYALSQARAEAALLGSLDEDNPYSGICRLACSGALAQLLYPRLLALQAEHPGLKVHMEAAPNARIINEVQQGDKDLGIITAPPPRGLFNEAEIGTQALCLVLPANAGTLTSADASTDEAALPSIDELKALGLISHPDAAHYLSLFFAHSKHEGYQDAFAEDFPVSSYINQLGQILLPVSLGLGFTVLPLSVAEQFSDRAKLRVCVGNERVFEPLYLIHKRQRQLPARFDTIRALIGSVLTGNPDPAGLQKHTDSHS
ncbi:LysR family transcriptional regulator [Shewanella litorisediminis]|uniref:LysR family transcriptional regulator n=1 Tax=Shewanella litorisediminis TaxID=1173586 RepID=A0ABX7G463_9GAMM|nr:LysR family transcriptional regulator [Shewanella litorisediminis]MCL2920108.1 LysR family transcriptional regulator [Shewanella litorisediminis]QRH02109.1 LysR family transcriptional regulator [Shewanella litorisediminis]